MVLLTRLGKKEQCNRGVAGVCVLRVQVNTCKNSASIGMQTLALSVWKLCATRTKSSNNS